MRPAFYFVCLRLRMRSSSDTKGGRRDFHQRCAFDYLRCDIRADTGRLHYDARVEETTAAASLNRRALIKSPDARIAPRCISCTRLAVSRFHVYSPGDLTRD